MAFSYSGIYLDKAHGKYKFYYAYFGVFKSGSWRSLKNIDRVAGISSILVRDSYATKNKVANLKMEDCFVVLFLKNRNRKIPFKRCKDLLEAKLEAQKVAHLLNLTIVQ
ncbi:hypothetical protein BZG02_04780 [Labilibaculum filiforme]|uniref:Uncharacterized protein n=2 Tax=Labilibaculum filiforme TaxID=1940526 RepID=A0A2N3I4B0_9BACT|nr:hypothetical protein BZG02_04780 [Labilibaculum filiforme]